MRVGLRWVGDVIAHEPKKLARRWEPIDADKKNQVFENSGRVSYLRPSVFICGPIKRGGVNLV